MKDKTKNIIAIRLPYELDKKLSELVSKIGIPKTAFILNLIYQELSKEKIDNCAEKEVRSE